MVDILFRLAIVVPFKNYEIIEKTEEYTKYNEHTGDKKVVKNVYKQIYYKDQEIDSIYDLRDIIEKETGLSLVFESDYQDQSVYIGKYLVELDYKTGSEPIELGLEELIEAENEVIVKMNNAGYKDVPRPFLYSFIDSF